MAQGTNLEEMLDSLADRSWNLAEFMMVGEAFDRWLVNHQADEQRAVESGLDHESSEDLVENAFMAGYKFAQREPSYVKKCE